MGLLGRWRRRRDDQPVDLDERSPQLGLRYRDLMLLHKISEGATDLSEPRHVLFYLYAPTAAAAESMLGPARDNGFTATVQEPLAEYPGHWPVVCETHAVLTPQFVRESVDFFEKLADTHQAEYDGWEAAM